MRRSIYERDVKKAFGRMNLEEITPSMLMNVCESIKKERDAPATAIHVREIVMQVFRFVQARGVKVENPADRVRASAIATFKPRERALSATISTALQAVNRAVFAENSPLAWILRSLHRPERAEFDAV